MPEPIENIREWLDSFCDSGLQLAVGDSALDIVILDRNSKELASFEIGCVPPDPPPSDEISEFAADAAAELIENGMEPEGACGIAADAERIIRDRLQQGGSDG